MSELHRKPPSSRGIPLLLALVTLAMLCALEVRHPYFFLQDDNRDQNLPYYVHNIRALLGGELPLFNFHQLLGTPILSCIQSAAFYPLNYLALVLSRLFLGHYFGTMDLIAAFHLTIAVLGFRRLMRHFGLCEASSCFGAVAWAFCGFVMTAGNSWIQVLGYAAYFPWILLCSLRQLHGFDLRNYLVLAALRTLDLFLGYPPFFAYTVIFDLLTVVILYGFLGGSRRHAAEEAAVVSHGAASRAWSGFGTFMASYFGNYLLVAGLSAALLLPALHQVSISADRKSVMSWAEYSEFSHAAGDWLHGLVVPFIDNGANAWFDPHFISHVGYLTLIFALVAVAGIRRSAAGRVVTGFCLLGAVAFLWAGDIVLTKLFYQLPIYNRLRWPFKLTFFTSFYLIVVASFGLDLFHGRIRALWPRAAKGVLWMLGIAHAASLLLLYLLLPQHMFSRHQDPVPLVEPLQRKLVGGRIVSFGLPIDMEGNKRIYGYSVPQLGFNYPTLFGLHGFGGYEILLSTRNSRATFGLRERSVFVAGPDIPAINFDELPLDYFRGWGVRWYILDRKIALGNIVNLVEVHRDERRRILFDSKALPFVFWADGSDVSDLAYRFSANALEMASQRASAGSLVLNVLHNPFFKATVDGKEAALAETGFGQMRLDLPAGRHRVVVRYVDPYCTAGLLASAATLLLVLVAVCISGVRSGRISFERLFALRGKLVVILFLAGLCLRTPILFAPHIEGDELIYMTLVEQLDSGNGYTLQGSPLLEQGMPDRESYDRPLFFHPPGGIALFWLFVRLFGPWGYHLAQLCCYALFFWGMVFLARSLKATSSDLGLILVAAASAFNPLMTHVTLKFWLDGPLLAFTTLAVVLFVRAVDQQNPRLALAAGVVFGYASLIKVTAFLAVPGALLLARSVANPLCQRSTIRFALLLLLPAFVVQLPWEIWQWQAVGSPFPGWAGKPSALTLALHEFITYVTVVRSPWVYLTFTPLIVWTLVPGILMVPLTWGDREVRRFGSSCLVWILVVVGFHVAVGYLGYSRLLRYIILITPATVLMFSGLLADVVWKVRVADISTGFRVQCSLAIAIAFLALALETATAVQVALNYDLAHILPLFGER